MIITGFRLGRLRAPLITPFRTALREVDAVDDVLLAIHTDTGHVGYGSAPATAVITGDTHASIIEAVQHHLMPRLIGQPIGALTALGRSVQSAIVHNTNAKAAVDIALFDLFAQSAGLPLCQALGSLPGTLDTNLTISLNSPQAMVADCVQAIERGFTSLKIKLGRDATADLERVRRIHDGVAGRATLRLDANQAWTPRETVHLLTQLEHGGIHPDLIEQPVPAHDLAGMRFVRDHVATPVMADESVFDVPQLLRAFDAGAMDIVNIKLMKAGGIAGALWMADLCAAHRMPAQIGCMLESAISVTAAAHVALARKHVITRIDLDAVALCPDPGVVLGTRFTDHRIDVGNTPGLGVSALSGATWSTPGPA